jgi:sugar phosphate isomerase/epimerase
MGERRKNALIVNEKEGNTMTDGSTTGKLTAEVIQQRLGFSTAAMRGNERLGTREIGMIREAGITRIEICGLHPPTHYDYHDAAQVSEITTECHKQGIAIVAMHGPNLPYDCPYEEVRRTVVKEALASARVAEEMGAFIFVGHFNTNDRSARTVGKILDCLDGNSIKLTVENGKDLKDFADFVDHIRSERFGMVVDIGHTRDADGINPFVKKERAREAMAACEHRLFHLHLHDFTDADHYPPFDGNIQWGEIFSALRDVGYTGELMFEAGPRVSFEDTLKKTAAFPNEFAVRYGA